MNPTSPGYGITCTHIPTTSSLEATSNSPRITLENRSVGVSDYHQWRLLRTQNQLSNTDPSIHLLKVVDIETNQIAAIGQWGFSRDAWEIQQQNPARKPNPNAQGTNEELKATNSKMMDEMEARNMPAGECYILMEIVTSTAFQRRGAASLIMEYGIQRADRDGVQCVLAASVMGVPLYRKWGFQSVDRFEIDLGVYGGEGVHVHGE